MAWVSGAGQATPTDSVAVFRHLHQSEVGYIIRNCCLYIYHVIHTGYSHFQETLLGKCFIPAWIQHILLIVALVCKSTTNIFELS